MKTLFVFRTEYLILLMILLFPVCDSNAQTTYNMTNGTVNTCDAYIYDDGGPSGDYSETNYEMTICAASGTDLYFVLETLGLGSAFNGDVDILIIYEGTGTGGTVLFDSDVDTAPTGIILSGAPCITITIDTDPHFFDTDPGAGFELLVSCTLPETCGDGILNNGEAQIDCGGPNCSPCYQPTSCGGVIVQNGDFETIDAFGCANNTDSEIHSNATSVESWYGTTEESGPQGGITPDYWTIAGCGVSPNITGSVGPCGSGQGALGFFPAREEIQSALAQPLEAGKQYCLTVDVAASSSNGETADLFFWFHNEVFSNGTGIYDLVADNGGAINIVTGPVGATPQIVNDPLNVFTNSCQQFTSSFCATGGESYIVAGGSYATGLAYLIIDNLVVSEACPLDFNSDILVVGTPDCAGNCVELVAQTSNQSGGCEVTNDFEFQWYEDGVLMPGEINDTLTNVCPTGAVIYSVEITYTAGCTSYTKPAVETSIPLCGSFTVNVDATPSTICDGDCTDLTATPSPAGAYTYSWTEQGDPTVLGTTDVINVCPTATTTYEVEVDDGASTVVETVVVTVNPLPTIDAGADETICDGGSVNLTATGGDTYVWDNGLGAGASHTVSPSTTTTYTVTGTDASGCENTDQVTITVNGTGASLTITGTDVSCFGDTDGTATVVASGTGPFTYDWQPTGGLSDVANGLSPGTYTVEVTDGNGCVSNETIDIDEPLELTVSTSSTDSDCTIDNGTATATPSGGTGAYSYGWTPSGQNTATANNLGAGSYDVTVTDDNGCQATESVIVGNVNGPTITVDNVTDISCAGETDGSASITANNGTPGYTYDWQPSGGSANNASGLSAGSYTVIVTDAAGCIASEIIEITEPNAIVIDAVVTDSDCGESNGSIALTATGGAGGYTYAWTPANGSNATITDLDQGTYDVVVTDANGCEETGSYQVDVIGGLDVTISPNPGVIQSGEEVGLTTTVTPGITGGTYTWSPSDGLSCNDCSDPIASPSSTTTYTVTVVSDDGCVGVDSVTVVVINPCEGAGLPTIFSPNGDGKNDHLCVISDCVSTMDLSVYNRWGERVFQSTSQEDCWDGIFRGEPVNSGVFVYKLSIVLTDGEEIDKTGNITVVR
ncbi:MAG: hypothetical protein COA32_13355 [Fluviicola sp.]|nr:MAG: hypothetical protein COA32_13355 [Fluviicola sp.]